ncbi:NUDIX hydrolase [Ancylobacter sp. G4_0304]|uniref:NUDIX hydrolase n=1 Tax=Ancylobacter sp. G4_0304 TaxID=3114289 RepID=UPI0039C64922
MTLTESPSLPDPALGTHPNLRPADAATLILVDRSQRAPRLLLGRRNARQAFMPGMFVFPGGRVEAQDRQMPVFGMLDEVTERRLNARVSRPSASRPRALALAAIRETCEETGLLLGTTDAGAPETAAAGWSAFVEAGVYPDLEALTFVARAVTPPRHSRRFDTRFFMAEASNIAHRLEGVVGPDSEFVDVQWMTFAQARKAEVPAITLAVIEEIETRLERGNKPWLPVPYFFSRNGRFHRETLD